MSGPQLAPDEKLCPFCAETIKAAAVKCRYCGSDLPPATPAETSIPRGQTPPETSIPRKSDVSAPHTPVELTSRRWSNHPTTAALLALLVAAAVLGSVLVGRHAWNAPTAQDDQIVSEVSRGVQLDQIARATSTVLSYQAASFEADSREAQALMTASMKAQYLSTLDKVRANVGKYGLNLTAKVAAIGLISDTKDEATALAFVNQTTTARDSKNTQVDQNRVVVTMVDTAAGWRISAIRPF